MVAHTEKQKKLLEELHLLDSQSVPFFDAKKRLLDRGYTEQEIVHALYSFGYDGKPNAPKRHDPVTTYFAANPREAERIAKYIIDNMSQGDYGRKTAYFLASQYGLGPHVRAKYSLKFADEFDYPIFTSLLSIIPGFLAAVLYDLPNATIFVGPALVTIYWLVRTHLG